MDRIEIDRLTRLEDTHWWYRERRHLVAKGIEGLWPGRALDVGAAGGGNTRVLRDHGWSAVALEYDELGAAIARSRGVDAVRGDARRLPFVSRSFDLVVAYDVLEHIVEDHDVVAEINRVLRPGGRLLVAVPADQALWSSHDEAVGHVRRYERKGLVRLLESSGLRVDSVRSWNVFLRPLVWWHRRRSSGSDLEPVNPVVNVALGGVIALERWVPIGRRRGVSLLAQASRRRQGVADDSGGTRITDQSSR